MTTYSHFNPPLNSDTIRTTKATTFFDGHQSPSKKLYPKTLSQVREGDDLSEAVGSPSSK